MRLDVRIYSLISRLITGLFSYIHSPSALSPKVQWRLMGADLSRFTWQGVQYQHSCLSLLILMPWLTGVKL